MKIKDNDLNKIDAIFKAVEKNEFNINNRIVFAKINEVNENREIIIDGIFKIMLKDCYGYYRYYFSLKDNPIENGNFINIFYINYKYSKNCLKIIDITEFDNPLNTVVYDYLKFLISKYDQFIADQIEKSDYFNQLKENYKDFKIKE